MYGTLARMRPRPGREQAVLALFDEWWRERGPIVPGARQGYVFRPDGQAGELVAVAVFADRESYRANAADPQQDAWYRRLRAELEADPAWEDGDFLSPHSAA